MSLNGLKFKTSRYIIDFFNLTRIGRQKFSSQWGVVKTHFEGSIMWVELLDKKVSIVLEDRKDLLSYVEETLIQLIPYDIINENVQYKIF